MHGTHDQALRLGLLVCALGLLVAAAGSPADELKMKVDADGVKVIYNESATQRSRRTATERVSVPEPRFETLIERESARHGFDPELVQAVVQAESGYNPRALSRKGAMGLMQLMPATARSFGVRDPYDPDENIRAGTAYLRRLIDRFGRLDLALAAYNAGPEAVERFDGVPPYPETRGYVERVLGLYGGDGALSLPRRGKRPVLIRRPGGRPLLTTADP